MNKQPVKPEIKKKYAADSLKYCMGHVQDVNNKDEKYIKEYIIVCSVCNNKVPIAMNGRCGPCTFSTKGHLLKGNPQDKKLFKSLLF